MAIYGSLSETYRRCGNPDCRCHHGGPKHGPHLYISYRGKDGKTTGYYVPHQAEAQIRQGVEAWSQLQDRLRELAALKQGALHPGQGQKITSHFTTAFSYDALIIARGSQRNVVCWHGNLNFLLVKTFEQTRKAFAE